MPPRALSVLSEHGVPVEQVPLLAPLSTYPTSVGALAVPPNVAAPGMLNVPVPGPGPVLVRVNVSTTLCPALIVCGVGAASVSEAAGVTVKFETSRQALEPPTPPE